MISFLVNRTRYIASFVGADVLCLWFRPALTRSEGGGKALGPTFRPKCLQALPCEPTAQFSSASHAPTFVEDRHAEQSQPSNARADGAWYWVTGRVIVHDINVV